MAFAEINGKNAMTNDKARSDECWVQCRGESFL